MRKNIIIILWFFVGMIWFSIGWNLEDMISQSEILLAGDDLIIQTLYSKWITIYDNSEDFNLQDTIRRDEAAKMFTLASDYIKSINEESDNVCEFSDVNLAWDDLQDIIVESCEKWLFKWSNGMFNPSGDITNAQVVTVIGRMIFGVQNETEGHYSDIYYQLIEKIWLLDWLENISWDENINLAATRGTVAKLIFNSLSI